MLVLGLQRRELSELVLEVPPCCVVFPYFVVLGILVLVECSIAVLAKFVLKCFFDWTLSNYSKAY
jgi:hypothetical protein